MEPHASNREIPMVGSDTPPTLAFTVGDEIILNTSDDGEAQVERWKKLGFTVVESTDNEVVLHFHGNSETATGSEFLGSEGTIVLVEEEEERESVSSPESPASIASAIEFADQTFFRCSCAQVFWDGFIGSLHWMCQGNQQYHLSHEAESVSSPESSSASASEFEELCHEAEPLLVGEGEGRDSIEKEECTIKGRIPSWRFSSGQRYLCSAQLEKLEPPMSMAHDCVMESQWKVPGMDDQKAYAAVKFETSCDRNTSGSRASLKLQLFNVQFGIYNCVDDKNNRGHFIYQLDVTVKPSEQWRNRVDHMFANPADDACQDVVNKQRSQTVGVSFDPRSSAQISASVSSAVSQDFYKHGWTAATVDPLDSKSVTWTWRISLWEDGQSFRPERPDRVSWGHLPKLPVNPKSVQLNNPHADATWEVPIAKVEFETEMKWDVRLTLHTAFVRQRRFKTFLLRPATEKETFTLDTQIITIAAPLVHS